jgi:hypothetical protein
MGDHVGGYFLLLLGSLSLAGSIHGARSLRSYIYLSDEPMLCSGDRTNGVTVCCPSGRPGICRCLLHGLDCLPIAKEQRPGLPSFRAEPFVTFFSIPKELWGAKKLPRISFGNVTRTVWSESDDESC